MDFDKVIRKRKSTRSFSRARKASWSKVLEAIDAVNQGPFAGNENNLKFVIVEEKKTIKELAKHCHQSFVAQSGLVIVVCAEDTNLEKKYDERGRIYSKQQSGAAIMTLILKLTDMKLASCWIGSYEDEFIRTTLGIPEHIQIEAIVPVGHETLKKTKKTIRKKDLEDVLRWENWKTKKRPALFGEHPQEPVEMY